MRKFKINVPKGVNYLSEWKKFRLFHFPYILDKQLTGCGFTSWILSNNQNVILCSPRRALLESKLKAYTDELEDIQKNNLSELNYKFYYAKNDYEESYGVDRDMNTVKPGFLQKLDEEITKNRNLASKNTEKFKQGVKNFILSCQETPFSESKYCKITVTYDSFRKVKEVLEDLNILKDFHIVVDEFQSIFTDSRFKSDTEMDFLKQLEDIQDLCYVSATPMIESYLDKLDSFKSLPFITIDWRSLDPNRVIEPKIEKTPCSKINQKVKEIVEKYRNNTWKDSDNNIIRSVNTKTGEIEEFSSREAVFYINSVKNICDIIKLCNMTQEECNVICAKTDNNAEQLRRAFKVKKDEFKGIGSVPGRKEMSKNKMFTFCTRTVYLGADFYSDNARTFIFSDANIDTLAVDITLDLPQIMGRQRLDENPWKNSATIYYRPLKDINIKDWSVFQNIIDEKIKMSKNLLMSYDITPTDEAKYYLARNYEIVAKTLNYRENYVAVNKHSGSTLIPKFNDLVMLSEIRAYEIQQLDYKDRFTVRNTINTKFGITEDYRVSEIIDKYEAYTNSIDKIEFICDVIDKMKLSEEIIDSILAKIDQYITNYVRVLGTDRIRSFSFRRKKLDIEVRKLINNQGVTNLSLEIHSKFKEGENISNIEIKNRLIGVYKSVGLDKTAIASDLSEWFVLKPSKVRDINGKRIPSQKLIKKL